MNHHASARFWAAYEALPATVREAADKSYSLLKADPRHPSLHFKRIAHFWSVHVGLHHRALGMDVDGGDVLWIGSDRTATMTGCSNPSGSDRCFGVDALT